jgi:integration host factor subunit alpha
MAGAGYQTRASGCFSTLAGGRATQRVTRPGERFFLRGLTELALSVYSFSMTKADVIDSVCSKVGFSKKESAEIVEMVFDTLKDTLERGEKIKLSGFGNFVVREKKSRVGRNPQTGQEIEISARRVLTFRPSQVLKNVLNKDD